MLSLHPLLLIGAKFIFPLTFLFLHHLQPFSGDQIDLQFLSRNNLLQLFWPLYNNNHVVPDGQGIEWGTVMRQGLAVFLTVFPSRQHAVATRGNPAPCGFVPRQVVHRTLMAAKDEGGSAWNHGAKVTLGAKEFVCMLPSCK